jgi:hypothetical protein
VVEGSHGDRNYIQELVLVDRGSQSFIVTIPQESRYEKFL